MIEFKGEQTGKCREFLFKKYGKIYRTIFLVTAVLFVIVGLWLSTLEGGFFDTLSKVAFIGVVLMVVIAFLPFGKMEPKKVLAQRIYIDTEEETIIREHDSSDVKEVFHMLNTVEKVLDYGEWYYFDFAYGDKDNCFACQKDLLTQGTLEEFEALFQGKIERV